MNGIGIERRVPALEVRNGDRLVDEGGRTVGSVHYCVDYDGHAWVTMCLVYGDDVVVPAMRLVGVTR